MWPKLRYGARMSPPREHRPIDERRQQLIDAGIELLAEEGVAAVTTRAVTSRAGLPHGSFHYCFPTKGALFAAILESEISQTMGVAFTPPQESHSAKEHLERGLLAHLELTRAHPERALALNELTAIAHRDPDLQHLSTWEHTEYIREVTANLDEWANTRKLRLTIPTSEAAAFLVAVADGVSSSWLKNRDADAANRSIKLAAQTIATLIEEDA
ncbi:TetR/AcrR family transcriptional regulator [Pseudoclavibacter terrae]|nr:TetR/AcrR family transcriptional regulator [Pseudoclavibacter terrae]